jgi:hypothetical protein
MSTLLQQGLRRNWKLAGALLAFLLFAIVHYLYFRPVASRYQTALTNAGGIEAVFNPGGTRPLLPPRVFALIAEQSLAPQDAIDRGGSGALGVVLLEDLGRLADRAGLRIQMSEPGPVTQQPLSVQIRAHLVLRGRYAQIVEFFDEIDRDESLLMVDQFRIVPADEGSDQLEIWITRLYLKTQGDTP